MSGMFWAALFFIIYTYFGYPVVIWALSRMRRELPPCRMMPDDGWPSVSVVIAVYNERSRLEAKLKNLRNLKYPPGKLFFVFVSDGSDDGTNDLLAAQSDVYLIQYRERRGKPHALNTAVAQLTTDIVVFADVRQRIEENAIYSLVGRLGDPDIGAVSGELHHYDPETATGQDIGLYWRYEKWIRKAESRFFSVAGVTGALYAIRIADWAPLSPDTLLDDFEVPMAILRSGRRIILEPAAAVYDISQEDLGGEKKRKIRTLTGNFQSFSRNSWLFSPKANPIFFQFVSHKVFRLLVPYAMAVVLVTSLFLPGLFFRLAVVAQMLFYMGGIAGLLRPALFSHRVFSFIAVFIELNWAAVVALKKFLDGSFEVKWEKT